MGGEVITDKSGSDTSAIQAYNDEHDTDIELRQCKYLNNIVEQDHRIVKQKMRAALGFKSFRSAQTTIAGLELVRMISKGQLCLMSDWTPAGIFNQLAV